MAAPAMINVGPQFNMAAFVQQLANLYRSRGFLVTIANFGPSTAITFDKNTGGANMLLGLGQGVTANCALNNNMLTINYTNEDWTGKIIGLAIGWFLCLIPFITAIVGVVRQTQLTKDLSNDAAMIAANCGATTAPNMGYTPGPMPGVPAQPYAQPYTQPVAATPTPQATPAAAQPQVVAETVTWACQCGAQGNTGAFCTICGSPRP